MSKWFHSKKGLNCFLIVLLCTDEVPLQKVVIYAKNVFLFLNDIIIYYVNRTTLEYNPLEYSLHFLTVFSCQMSVWLIPVSYM